MKYKMFNPFHLVTLSPWPLIMSMNIMNLLISIIWWFNNLTLLYLYVNFMMNLMNLFQWWRDVIRESLFQGFHTSKVTKGIKLGMILFIISEMFFFISIFWTNFHMFLSPNIEIGNQWPPKNIVTFNPYEIPLLNTMILLSSGITITWCHYSILTSKKFNSLLSLYITLSLGMIFSLFQFKEYQFASFTLADSSYGSIFFLSTGFHGFHVLMGTMFLMINFLRLINKEFSKIHHLGFEMAAWYWHFVDVIWLFLYLSIYYWP